MTKNLRVVLLQMFMFRAVCTFFLLISIGCNPNNQIIEDIEGDWIAANLTEEGVDQVTDLSTVCLSFRNDHTYNFHGTLRYFESGTFDIRNNTLYVVPTGEGSDSIPRTMELITISTDTLRILMLDENRERVLTLVRPVL
jgi:hypothetical protein